jgi:transcriptional regulator with XRE-family HTH domain
MNPLQSKMARTALGWSVTDLSTFSGVGRSTVARFELGQNVQPDRVQAMRRTFEGKGVQFLDGGKLAGGVVPPRD